jgi:hypothetical protein
VSQQEPSEEELRAALEEQMRHVRVEDVLVQTAVTLINLGARRLGLTGPEGGDEVDSEQARLAIEGARALLPLLPDVQELGPVRDALSQLQIAFVQKTQSAGGGQPAAGEEPAPQAPPSEADREAEERAKARAKLWTPPGS